MTHSAGGDDVEVTWSPLCCTGEGAIAVPRSTQTPNMLPVNILRALSRAPADAVGSHRSAFRAKCNGATSGLRRHPIAAHAHVDQERHVQLCSTFHLAFHQGTKRRVFVWRELEHEFVVHLQ